MCTLPRLAAGALAAGALIAALLAGAAAAQETTDPGGLLGPDESFSPGGPPRLPRAVLLREGSTLRRVTGAVAGDEQSRAWTFTVDPARADAPRHVFTIMPNTLLWELEEIVESMPDDALRFEITGTVFVYSNRNYVLLTHPPLVVERTPRGAAPMGSEAEEPSGGATPPEIAPGDTAEDIIRALEEDVGPVTRRPERTAARAAAPHREGDMILQRRGSVRRSGDGSFVFVFTADKDGQADPPMILMPCLLLERIEATLDQQGASTTLLVSGQVHAYDGHEYLLPTMYRVPVERTRISE